MPDISLMGAVYSDVPAVDLPKSGGGTARFYDPNEILYAASPTSGGPATVTNGIHYGAVDSTSTATAFTASISGITSYYDGLTVMLKNGVVTSTTNFTVDINGLGAKGVYSNMAAATRESSIFNVNYTLMLVYDSTRVSGGCWVNYRGYNSDTNTIGYQLRTNSTVLKTTDRTRYYRLLFTSADGTKWVPANTNYDNSATSTKTVNQRKINPFGRIVYLGNSTNYASGADIPATSIWQQYALVLGYSFNTTGAALSLTTQTPVYVKAAPQSDGSAIIDSTTPYVQALPSTEDEKIYIYLGIAYDATHIELQDQHPVYYYKDGEIRLWTNAAASGGGAVDSVNGKTGAVVLTTSDLANDSGFITGMEILSYGISTWNDFITAYNAKKVVYCRASSNTNPSTGTQNRLAFMAYVNDASSPTEVEFQYYRSVATHSDSQQGDQVFVYKLTSVGTWTVTTREAYTKIVASTGLNSSYSGGKLTLTAKAPSIIAKKLELYITSDGQGGWSVAKDNITGLGTNNLAIWFEYICMDAVLFKENSLFIEDVSDADYKVYHLTSYKTQTTQGAYDYETTADFLFTATEEDSTGIWHRQINVHVNDFYANTFVGNSVVTTSDHRVVTF